MTLQIKLPAAFTDVDLPRLQVDPILPETGALWLYDFAHPAAPLDGLPAHNGVATNIAAEQAFDLIGSGDLSQYQGKWGVGASVNTADVAKFERTSKGGLHVITRQSSDPGGTAYVDITMLGSPVAARLGAANDRVYYMSVWGRTTRGQLPIGAGFTASIVEAWGPEGPPTGHYRAYIYYGRNQPGGAGSLDGRTVDQTALAPFHGNLRSNSYVGSQSNPAGLALAPVVLGMAGVYGFDANMRKSNPSRVIYRSYCEDLTASGRSYAEVDAIDHALYTRDVLTPGGRFHGDTFTDPATIP